MNDVLLYTYPQQDGKYRLKNSLPLTGMKVRVLHLSLSRFSLSHVSLSLTVFFPSQFTKFLSPLCLYHSPPHFSLPLSLVLSIILSLSLLLPLAFISPSFPLSLSSSSLSLYTLLKPICPLAHGFLMGLCDVLLMFQVSKPIIENVPNALSIEGAAISITLAARWVTLTHTHTLGGMVGIMIVVHTSHGHQMH